MAVVGPEAEDDIGARGERATPDPTAAGGREPEGARASAAPRAARSAGARRAGEPSAAVEAQLLRRIAERDRRAFDLLYRGYYRRLTRFLDRMTSRPTMSEEVLNDTMLVVWQKAHTFDATSRVSTWIFAIAYRKALKALARAGRAARVAQPAAAHEPAAPGREEPESQAMRGESRARIAGALAALSPEHRAVITMTYYHGYAYREIASIVGCPVDTVKTRMFHARRRLRVLLGSQEDVG